MNRKFLSLTVFVGVLLALLVGCGEKEPEQGGIELVDVEGHVPVGLKADGISATLEAASSTFYVTRPGETDFSSVDLVFSTEATIILMGDQKVGPVLSGVNLNQPVKFRFFLKGLYQDYTVVARNSGLPIVRIETPEHRGITSKDVWLEGATMQIVTPEGEELYQGSTDIRGRGNSTWGYPKKPYALRLAKKAELLSMPAHKRWVLLANWKDRTILRNDAAFWLSREAGLPYTVRGQFVELVLNGKHQGNYYLCEQIKIDKVRVPVDKMDAGETDPEKITGGYLLELDTYYDEPLKFTFPDRFNLPWMVKEPDEEDISTAAFDYIRNWIGALETLLKDEAKVQAHAYEEYVDVDSAIDYLIVEELTGNNDFYGTWPSVGPHSAYMYKARNGKLYSGPVWDFDYHTFYPGGSRTWVGAKKTMLYPALQKDPKFQARLVERWNARKAALKKLPDYIDSQVDYLRVSESVNQQLWPISNRENGDETMTFQQAVDRMKKSFLDKWEWMDENIGK